MIRRIRVSSCPPVLRTGEVLFAFRTGDDHVISRDPAFDPTTGRVCLRGVVVVDGIRMVAAGAVRPIAYSSDGLLEVEEVSREVGQRAVSLLNSKVRA